LTLDQLIDRLLKIKTDIDGSGDFEVYYDDFDGYHVINEASRYTDTILLTK